jgi:chromosome segregation ATPase
MLEIVVRIFPFIQKENAHFCLQVEPDITRKSDTGRQTKTLSGGEKSFSTICMLLSLWEAMGSPIRCLDELYAWPI